MTTDDREIYPNAPLRFVAFELRTPHVPQFGSLQGTTPLYDAMRDLVPVIASNPAVDVQPPMNAVALATGGAIRFLNRRRTLSISVAPTALIVENSDYERFEGFLEVVDRLLRAAAAAASIAGMQRIGLRYIDEVRVPGVADPEEWSPYIHRSLLAALDLDPQFHAHVTQGIAEFKVSEQHQAVMRFGALRNGVVDPRGPLRLKTEEQGPCFLIDLDSFWVAPPEELPEFSPDRVVEVCLTLRKPVRALFEAAITDRLRNDVLRRRPE